MTTDVLVKSRVGNAAHAQEVRKKESDETARWDGGGLEASQLAGATQDGELEMRQLQHHPKLQPKLKLQLKQKPEQQHEPNHKPAPTPARWW